MICSLLLAAATLQTPPTPANPRTQTDFEQAVKVLESLAQLPSYFTFDGDSTLDPNDPANWLIPGREPTPGNEAQRVAAGYLALTEVSTKAFHLAYRAAEIKWWDEEHPDWRLSARPKETDEVTPLLPYVQGPLTERIGLFHFQTLFWLIFVESEQMVADWRNGETPWKFDGDAILLHPVERFFNTRSAHYVRIPDLDELEKLNRRNLFP